MRCIVEALRGLRVPVCVIADFDVLRDDATLRRLVGSLGGTGLPSKTTGARS